MIGNDVIDLCLASRQSNWKRRGFLDKIFTLQEQKLILSATNPDTIVWLLWSRKEAVYKIWNRQSGKRAFNPLEFQSTEANSSGIVRFGQEVFFVESQLSSEYIHTVAVTEVDHLPLVTYCPAQELQKQAGLPYFQINGHFVDASLSHHGRFESAIYLNGFSSGKGTISSSPGMLPNS